MTSATPHLDLGKILLLAGEATFAKGMLLVKAGKVHQLTWQENSVSAKVEGNHAYQVSLHIDEEEVSSSCTCPAATYQVMCKHAVATAIALMARLEQKKDGKESKSEAERLRSLFMRQEKEALIALLLEELGRDERRWQHWLQRADRSDQPITQTSLKKQIDEALPKESLWEWREVADYFDAAENQFEAIWEALELLPVEAQWALVEHALSRLNLVLEQIDDSGGHRFGIEGELNSRLPTLFQQLPWSEQQQADWLFKHLLEKPLDLFPSLSDFGDAGTNPHLLALCEQALERQQGPSDSWQIKWQRQRYAEPLLAAARANGQWRTELSIKSRLAQNVSDLLELCQLCLANQEPLDGEYWLTKARQQANHPQDQLRCNRMEIRLSEELDDKPRAWALANRLFEQQPSFAEFQELRQLQQRLDWPDEGLLQRVEQALQAIYRPAEGSLIRSQSDALLWFYLDQGREDEACDWVKERQVGAKALLTLADRVLQRRPLDALCYHFRVAAATVAQTNNDAYQQVVTQLQQLEKALPGDEAIRAHFFQQVNALATEHKRKRNFIQLLDAHLPRC